MPTKQILNLTTTHKRKAQWDLGLIELSRRDHELLVNVVKSRDGCTSFTLPYLLVIKELIESYELDAVYIEDEMNKPGVIEMINYDLNLPVILLSEKERVTMRFVPSSEAVLIA